MIWLASYPRSGNTFFRIVLHEVYGIDSVDFVGGPSLEPVRHFPVLKTHLLPDDLPPDGQDVPAVYLVRDGRDAVVSMAHLRSDIIVPGSSQVLNMLRIILARRKNHFGGWSRHVKQWRKRAVLVLRFEDLILDPVGCVEQVRPWLDLPTPRVDRLPTFRDLRSKGYELNSHPSPLHSEVFRQQFFRRGQVSTWRNEMPPSLRLLFRLCHGRVLRELGYGWSNAERPLNESGKPGSGHRAA